MNYAKLNCQNGVMILIWSLWLCILLQDPCMNNVCQCEISQKVRVECDWLSIECISMIILIKHFRIMRLSNLADNHIEKLTILHTSGQNTPTQHSYSVWEINEYSSILVLKRPWPTLRQFLWRTICLLAVQVRHWAYWRWGSNMPL